MQGGAGQRVTRAGFCRFIWSACRFKNRGRPVLCLYYQVSGNDNLTGTAGDDTIDALDGSDTVDVVAGNDTIFGGAGNDFLNGGLGSDVIHGGDGNYFIQMVEMAATRCSVRAATTLLNFGYYAAQSGDGGAGNDTFSTPICSHQTRQSRLERTATRLT